MRAITNTGYRAHTALHFSQLLNLYSPIIVVYFPVHFRIVCMIIEYITLIFEEPASNNKRELIDGSLFFWFLAKYVTLKGVLRVTEKDNNVCFKVEHS